MKNYFLKFKTKHKNKIVHKIVNNTTICSLKIKISCLFLIQMGEDIEMECLNDISYSKIHGIVGIRSFLLHLLLDRNLEFI
jgi:hypothetical protein